MSNIKITIIMPSLNVKGYIEKCMDSVLNQTCHDIEILAIDAGSTDGTLEILRDYEKKDSRIRVIVSEKKSYGYQINLGISKAGGDYIGIVETDDFIAPNMYEKLLDTIRQYDVDYVKAEGVFAYELFDGEVYTRSISTVDSKLQNKALIVKDNPELEYIDRFIWLGLYKRSIMEQIHLNESAGAAYQDIGFAVQLQNMAKTACYISDVIYFYRLDNENASGYNTKAFDYLCGEYKYCEPYIDRMTESQKSYFYKKCLTQIVTRHRFMAESGRYRDENVDKINWLSEYINKAINNRYIDINELDDETRVDWKLLNESPYLLYGNFRGDILRVDARVEKLRNRISNRDVILFGCGKKSLLVHAVVERNNLGKLVAYCDNNTNENTQELRGLPVMTFKDASEKYKDAFYIITSWKYGTEIKKQLQDNGIEEERIYIYDLGESNALLVRHI